MGMEMTSPLTWFSPQPFLRSCFHFLLSLLSLPLPFAPSATGSLLSRRGKSVEEGELQGNVGKGDAMGQKGTRAEPGLLLLLPSECARRTSGVGSGHAFLFCRSQKFCVSLTSVIFGAPEGKWDT